VEIFESFAEPIVNAAQCLVFNWKHFSSVNWWNKFGRIGNPLALSHSHSRIWNQWQFKGLNQAIPQTMAW
jgi:hypothetical protein